MKVLLRLSISVCLILAALFAIFLFKSAPATGQFVLITGSGIGIAIGISLLLSTLFPFIKQVAKGKEIAEEPKRKTERLTDEEIVRRLEEKLKGTPPPYLEEKLICEVSSIAAYLKKRGAATGKLTERGQYSTYEIWASGVKKTVEELLRKYPQLREQSYTLDPLSKINPYALSNLLESFSSLYETLCRAKLDFAPKKILRSLASVLNKYI